MRTVTYFCGGKVADFPIPNELFESFVFNLKPDKYHSEAELGRARSVLDVFIRQEGDDLHAGPYELAAACYVWHYFNTNKRADQRIEGDVVIVDLNGEGSTIEYAAASDIQIAPDS